MRRRALVALGPVAAAVALALALSSGGAGAQPRKADVVLLPPGGDRMYLAANPDFGGAESGVTRARITGFEQKVGREIAWAYFSNNWFGGVNFPAADFAAIRRTGRVPFVRLMARSGFRDYAQDRRYSLQSIIDGDWDEPRKGSEGLRSWCRQAAALGYPILAEFGTEANGAWFPWNGKWNGGARTDGYGDPELADGPERFRDAYRHVVSLCREEGADQITWFFHVDADGQPAARWNRPLAYYPGADYVDWLGISFYGSLSSRWDWEQLRAGLDRIYPELVRVGEADGLPLALLEFGVREDTERRGRKARWIDQASRDLRTRYPALEAASWWNEEWNDPVEHVDVTVDSSPSALRAYRRLVSSPRWVTTPVFGPR
jgi:hypothetical protein